ncbi:efflux RND transporter periplasmic adaptor subunit [Pseudomonas sp. MM211]|uniref:multidrug efflux RND transporter periplasmic adaptor subunit MexE n=1 Tax=Pseudomonas sp. MM211 TaxID=2866808 RepID=UPI001CED673E|nr:efflux RND transporter periplasmic adaptor subunit [Pseudomonas sp. MM211]UCJ15432.1 efflux RND transporter periplasmic adaptor subunit [Pseudomonas sp. MM211]
MEQPTTRLWPFPLALAATLVLAACGKSEDVAQQQMPAAKVTVAEVIEQPLNEWDEFTGRLEAPESVQIRPRVSGFVDKVSFNEGALVKKGDLLFQIDPRPFQAEVKRLEAQLQQSRANQARTVSESRRGERLREGNAISAELADARKTAAQEAQAAVAGIQAELDNARLNLSFTRVTAPIDGRVSRAEVTAGNLVTASESLLTSLVSTDKVYAYFDADERAFLKYTELARQSGQDSRGKSPVYLGLSNEDGNPHLGQLDFLDNQVNPRTGTIRGRAVFDNADGRFTPGLYARLKLVGSDTYDATLIQDVAVGTDLGKKFVLVLGTDNKVVYRSVQLGPKLEGLRIVRDGLAKGERIVVNGLQRAIPGSTVDPQAVPMADEKTLAALERQRRAVASARAERNDEPLKVSLK